MEKKKLLNGLSALLFVVAIVLWFVVDAVVWKNSASSTFSFIGLAFGETVTFPLIGEVGLKFSFLNFLTLLFLFGGALLAAYRVVLKPKGKGKKRKKSADKLFGFIVFALGMFAVVFILLAKSFAVTTHSSLNLDDFKLTGGAIAILILAGLGGLSSVASDII